MRIFFCLILLVLCGCSTPKIVVDNGSGIGIESGGKRLTNTAKPIMTDRVLLDRVSVERTLYKTRDEAHWVYVSASVKPQFFFQNDVKDSLRIVFNARKVRKIEREDNLGFYALVFKEGGTLFVLAENRNKRGIRMIYGLDRRQMSRLLVDMGFSSEAASVDAMSEIISLSETSAAFLDRWTPKMFILDGLIKKQGVRPANRFPRAF
jgi:hypothetical protein